MKNRVWNLFRPLELFSVTVNLRIQCNVLFDQSQYFAEHYIIMCTRIPNDVLFIVFCLFKTCQDVAISIINVCFKYYQPKIIFKIQFAK